MIKKIVPKDQLDQVLSSTKRIIRHQREKEFLLGEKFNIFSILNLERKENGTHSAFLGELLNPDGSHLRGNIFLRLFLETIGNKSIDIESARVKLEYVIGKINYEKETGGRIDIFIWDKFGNCASIENKIDALDQYAQIRRYFHFRQKLNSVYYLTKSGENPSIESCGNLVSGKDFYTISYKSEIIQWLQKCLNESAEFPILRESIKQYLILIKKITLTMNNVDEKELYDLMLKNGEESSYIASNYSKAVLNVYSNLRERIFESLERKISDRYNLYIGSKVDASISHIWIKIKGRSETVLFFGIQGFSMDNGLMIGIFVLNGLYKSEYETLGSKGSNYWIEEKLYDDFDGYTTDITNCKTIYKLYSDQMFFTGFVNHIVENTIIYLDEHFDSVNALLPDL